MFKIRIVSSIFLIFLLFFALSFDYAFDTIIIYIFSFFCLWEFFRLISVSKYRIYNENNNFYLTRTKINFIDFFQIFIIQFSFYFFSIEKEIISLIIILLLSVYNLYFRKHNNLLATIGVIYIFIPFISIINFYEIKNDLVLFVLIVAISTDIGGYTFGKLIKGPKIFPLTSPNKTWAGFLGGILLTLTVSFLFYEFPEKSNFNSIFLIIAFSIFCQLGDYIESYLKRFCNVKDSSNLIPGHGGILDRLDGILFLLIIMFLLDLMNYNFMYLFIII